MNSYERDASVLKGSQRLLNLASGLGANDADTQALHLLL